MASPATTDPRYPIGRFTPPAVYTPEILEASIVALAALPENLRAAVDGFSREQIDTPYREGGWTVRQLVHHVADSHMNAYCRVKQALTEDWPPVAAYDENRWAQLADARTPVQISLDLLESLHRRWVAVFSSLQPEDWESRGYMHSVGGRSTLAWVVACYAWHSDHHVAHVTALRKNRGW
ncbi:YfiT family bacillithiol transferase [Silvibacterium dinghuense]|uniref:Putative metal-dependent hydrolase n=1 Tax=Silvibacterium dinghuense TaxID=1560006 RepID=A0A4V1NUT0_9BACT|nr:putative metal-dependent hydrolase [Silvibacterium dinghuense]RXS93308.1 putative metal-dependent hydrolase [Silvibacterium dinghuense]GGH04781.1 putative metal-dependent hydrolase [Silvibacterium dinghuense]